jgi:protocatechuate 3,4-dioxygenase beta subunit
MYHKDIAQRPKGADLSNVFAPAELATSGPLEPTLTQVWGPFFAAGAPFRAKLSPPGITGGTTLILRGTVYDSDTGLPVPFAVLDLWQASHSQGPKGGL